IGVVGKRKKLMRVGGLSTQRSYVQAAAQQMEHDGQTAALPGLADAASAVAIPLLKGDELIGVFYVESTQPAVFDDGDLGLVEAQGPRENFAFINEYLTYMEAPIKAHDGFIDSYRGDGIMALFAGRADDAVMAAIDSMRALGRLNQVRTGRGERPVRIGIGI